MGEVERCSPTRVLFTQEELSNFDKEQLLQHWSKQENYINWMESQLSSAQIALTPLRDLEEKLRHSISSESARRESILLLRLNSKEQEIQDLIIQIQELKASQAGNSASLRSSLLDPAVNVLIQHLRKELDKAKLALEETQNELSAWKFTPDSNTGKRLMAKCRLLYQENEELGRMISSGRMAKLEGDLALQRNFSEEMKKSQSELDEFLLELDEDVEGMQSTIYFLQQQLRQTREQLASVQKENDILRNSSISNDKTGGSFYHPSSSHLVGPLSEWCNGPAQSSSKRNFEKIHEHTGTKQAVDDSFSKSDGSLISDPPTTISNANTNSEIGIDEAEARNISACHSAAESGEMSPQSLHDSSLSFIGKREGSCQGDAISSTRDAAALDSSPRSSYCIPAKSSEDTSYHRFDAVEASALSIPDYHHKFHNDVLDDSREENETELRECSNRFPGRKIRPDATTNVKSQDEKIVAQLSGIEKKNKFVGSSENGSVILGVLSSNLTTDDDKTEQIPEDDDKKTFFRKRTLSLTEKEVTSLHSSVNSSCEANSELGKNIDGDSCSKSEGESSFTKRSRIDLTGNPSIRAKTD